MAHAVEHRRPHGIMSDPTAASWLEALLNVYSEVPNPEPELINGLITRSIIIDYALLAFSRLHNRTSVVDLGCGFSTRFYRLGFGGYNIEAWIHVDLPEVLQARLTLGQMSQCELAVGRDLCNLEHQGIPLSPSFEFTLNHLFLLEGVLNHLPKDKAKSLLEHMRKVCRGGTVLGTVMTERCKETLSETYGTPLPLWGVNDTAELETWLKPARIDRIWLLGKVASRIGLIRPLLADEASGLVFLAQL